MVLSSCTDTCPVALRRRLMMMMRRVIAGPGGQALPRLLPCRAINTCDAIRLAAFATGGSHVAAIVDRQVAVGSWSIYPGPSCSFRTSVSSSHSP